MLPKNPPKNPSSSPAKDCLAGVFQVRLPAWAIPVQEQPVYKTGGKL